VQQQQQQQRRRRRRRWRHTATESAPQRQFSTYLPGLVPAGMRRVSTISRLGSSHAKTLGEPEHLHTPGGGCHTTGFGGTTHQVTSAACSQPAALRADHCSSAHASQWSWPACFAFLQCVARAAAQLCDGWVPLAAGLGGAIVRVQRWAVSWQSWLSSQYGSKLGPSRFQSIGGPGSGFFVHWEEAGNTWEPVMRVALNSFCVVGSPSQRRMDGPSACRGSLLKAASFRGSLAGASR
jgi:hypothetical protein